jgi:hypothetical protein
MPGSGRPATELTPQEAASVDRHRLDSANAE